MSQIIERQIALHVTAAQAHEAAATAHREDGPYSHPAQWSWHLTGVARHATDRAAIHQPPADGTEEACLMGLDTAHESAATLHGHAARAHWREAEALREQQPDGPECIDGAP